MNKFLCLTIILLAINFAIGEKQQSYHGYKLANLLPKTVDHLAHLNGLQNRSDIDFWTSIQGLNKSVHVLLSPEAFETYSSKFKSIKLDFKIDQDNIQELIEEQLKSMTNKKRATSIVGKYARYSEIQSFIDETVASNPNLASSYIAGQTYQKRNLKVIVLKTATSKKNIWIDCGIHAREWVTPSTCVWIINKLVTEYNSNVQSTVDLLNYYEFHILPLLNPDGYEYSQTTSRLWRKNRNPNAGYTCVGTDLNRNFGYQWYTGGSSNYPCDDTYAGKAKNSELETLAVENAILKYPGKWDSYLTIHSYGAWWFTTWGYTNKALPSSYNDQKAKADIGVNALQSVYKTKGWITGSSAYILYIASGGSEDWAQGVAGIKYSNCLELRPGDQDPDYRYGFLLPEDRAQKVGEETYQGIKAFVSAIKANY